jgi:hypothetical protein
MPSPVCPRYSEWRLRAGDERKYMVLQSTSDPEIPTRITSLTARLPRRSFRWYAVWDGCTLTRDVNYLLRKAPPHGCTWYVPHVDTFRAV